MNRVAVLGATGTVGQRAVEVAEHVGARVAVLGARTASDTLRALVRRVRPEAVYIADRREARLAERWGMSAHVLTGEGGLMEAALWPDVSCVVVAVLGLHGLRPTLAALNADRKVALANKEAMVVGGRLIRATGHMDQVVPVDSEHAALYQILMGRPGHDVVRLTLTSTGGALRTWPLERLSQAGVSDVLRHPIWSMGRKITVDSATMMNKGLELIEAHMLFDMGYDALDVLIHPETIVHAMVHFGDGSVLAHMAMPDMALPIQAALTGAHGRPAMVPALDLAAVSGLHFERPDAARYPALDLAVEAGRRGGVFPAILNAADEEAVQAFLEGRLPFTGIVPVVAHTLEEAKDPGKGDRMDELLAADAWARQVAQTMIAEASAS